MRIIKCVVVWEEERRPAKGVGPNTMDSVAAIVEVEVLPSVFTLRLGHVLCTVCCSWCIHVPVASQSSTFVGIQSSHVFTICRSRLGWMGSESGIMAPPCPLCFAVYCVYFAYRHSLESSTQHVVPSSMSHFMHEEAIGQEALSDVEASRGRAL